jgi:PE family
MSFVTTHPEALTTAASHLNGVGSALASQNVAASAATTCLPAAADDDVSALIATQFSAHAAVYRAVSNQAMAIHESFAAILAASASSYAATEAANTIAAM